MSILTQNYLKKNWKYIWTDFYDIKYPHFKYFICYNKPSITNVGRLKMEISRNNKALL